MASVTGTMVSLHERIAGSKKAQAVERRGQLLKHWKIGIRSTV